MKRLNLGDKLMLAGVTWTAFKISDGGDVYILMDGSYCKKYFGKNNDYRYSNVRAYLLNGEILFRIKKELGDSALVPITLDLTSGDGLDDYGKVEGDELALLDANLYYENRERIPVLDGWFWLATPDSTPSGVGSGYVQYVNSNGGVGYAGCYWNYGGVRPFCILSSSIFES